MVGAQLLHRVLPAPHALALSIADGTGDTDAHGFMFSVRSISRSMNGRANATYVYSAAMSLLREVFLMMVGGSLLFVTGALAAVWVRRGRVRRLTRARLYALVRP